MRHRPQPFGKTADGIPVAVHALEAPGGLRARVMDLGATLLSLEAPDRAGRRTNVVLGRADVPGYEAAGDRYLGATVGRCANRIAGAAFELDGEAFALHANEGPNHLHGGRRGFDKRVWRAEPRGAAVRFSRTSPAGEEGYPGTLAVAVTYTVGADELRIDYAATTDAPTLVNLTHHSYFDLSGRGGGAVQEHELALRAAAYTPADDALLPLGTIAPVAGTPLDLTASTPLREDLDHNFALDAGGGALALAATLRHRPSGRALEVLTTEPGLQVYTGGGGVCLEAQRFPDAVHHPGFPSVVLRPGELYAQTTVYRFRRA